MVPITPNIVSGEAPVSGMPQFHERFEEELDGMQGPSGHREEGR